MNATLRVPTNHRVGKLKWLSAALTGLVALALVASSCGSNDTGLDTAEGLYGAWHDITPGHGVYLTFDEDGRWGVYLTADVELAPYAWGTYTLDGAEITMVDDPDTTICPGAVGVWTIEFLKNGDEAYFTFVEDSCTQSIRGEDWTLIKQTP